MEKISNLLMAHHLLGATLVTEKNWFRKKFGIFFQNMIRNMTGKFEIFFSKFHHTHEHEQSPRHQQGLIGLI